MNTFIPSPTPGAQSVGCEGGCVCLRGCRDVVVKTNSLLRVEPLSVSQLVTFLTGRSHLLLLLLLPPPLLFFLLIISILGLM